MIRILKDRNSVEYTTIVSSSYLQNFYRNSIENFQEYNLLELYFSLVQQISDVVAYNTAFSFIILKKNEHEQFAPEAKTFSKDLKKLGMTQDSFFDSKNGNPENNKLIFGSYKIEIFIF